MNKMAHENEQFGSFYRLKFEPICSLYSKFMYIIK